MQYVEINLDGVNVVKRCPIFKKGDGTPDYAEIRRHFIEMGYAVGTYLRIC
ncbi:hypothetical protein [Noviherbaspirillum pedocola]|uniref:Uncharacterized protein n=1 Tax=Noviherbaspirillum pedocola TaxID=2801341 RepID=A0A934SV35_9BURK|nr:hypothetical protein [Noviherbaspirillum pedocola]MBK4735980.1 hypothetical protein [Noviherbaspirillum pedocola]